MAVLPLYFICYIYGGTALIFRTLYSWQYCLYISYTIFIAVMLLYFLRYIHGYMKSWPLQLARCTCLSGALISRMKYFIRNNAPDLWGAVLENVTNCMLPEIIPTFLKLPVSSWNHNTNRNNVRKSLVICTTQLVGGALLKKLKNMLKFVKHF